LIAGGVAGLSVVFGLPARVGQGSDAPLVHDEGRQGRRRGGRHAPAAWTFFPEPVFSRFEPWFGEVDACVEAGEFERFVDACDRIEGFLALVSASGPVAEFLLHVGRDRAWFRRGGEPAAG
jgi:hypothetical protein